MTPSTRLAAFLSGFLAPGAALTFAGCIVIEFPGTDGTTDTTDSGTYALDDEACLNVAVGEACPSDADASVLLVGTETCESPVREVVRTGAFLSSSDVVYTGYGGYDPYGGTGDTGGSGDAYTRCCYEAAYIEHPETSCTIGRPLVVDGRMVSAAATARSDWGCDEVPDLSGLDDEARRALTVAWRDAGLLEHASVPAFARVLLELVALGAPAGLVARTTAAIADEIVHARACFALASAYAGHPIGPDALHVPTNPAPSLVRLAVETFREGCVGETLAVGFAAAQLREATDPVVRSVLERIVRDEGQHASLAWDILRWAVAQGGAPVRAAVAEAVAALRPETWGDGLRAGPAASRSHGIASPETVALALDGVYRGVIAPSAAELLSA